MRPFAQRDRGPDAVRGPLAEASGGSARDRQLAVIGGLHEQFVLRGIEYWLFGGWAVDFHVGRVTRPHDDIDIAIWKRDFDLVHRLLGQGGWNRCPQAGEDGYTGYDKAAIHLDLAFLARDADGVYTPLDEGRGTWSDGAFGQDLIELEGVRGRVVSIASLLADKSEGRDDPSAGRKDRADVAALGLMRPEG